MQYPMTNPYQLQMPQLQMPQLQVPQAVQPQQQIQYVNGRESANAYQIGPNSSVLLMDSNEAKFYIKTSDASGFCTVKTYTFQEEVENTENSQYVTKSEFEEFKQQLLKGVSNESATSGQHNDTSTPSDDERSKSSGFFNANS